jgi:hypothetical protein
MRFQAMLPRLQPGLLSWRSSKRGRAERSLEVDWRPELLDGALLRRHKRLIRRRAGLAAGTVRLAVTVLAVSVSAVSSGGVRNATPKVQTAAYVVSRRRSAVDATRGDVVKVDPQVADGWSYTTWMSPRLGRAASTCIHPAAVRCSTT